MAAGHQAARSARAPDGCPTWPRTRSLDRRRPRSATAAWTSTAWRPRPVGRHHRRRGPEHPRDTPTSAACRRTQALHHYLEATRPRVRRPQPRTSATRLVDVPTRPCCSQRFADEPRLPDRPGSARWSSRSPPGDPDGATGCADRGAAAPVDRAGQSTTHLTVADRWGNVVSYTLTIEQTGGSGIVVPGRGFLLNNELTDFNFAPYDRPRDPNRPGRQAAAVARCRRRSCSTARPARATRSARPAARRSSPPCCRSWSTGSTSA